VILGYSIKNSGSKSIDFGTAKLYHAIYLNSDSHDIEIAWGSIKDNFGGRGIQVFHNNDVRFNIIIHDNRISETHLDSIVLGNGTTTGNKIYNNILEHNNSRVGANNGCIFTDELSCEVEIYNNTLVGDDDVLLLFSKHTLAVVRNNICYATGLASYFLKNSGATTPVASDNIWFGQGSPPVWDDNPENSDPLFVNSSVGDYSLQSGSPAIDRGIDEITPGVPLDFGGVPRQLGPALDLGALEKE